MKLAVIADIHGNVEALKAVLENIKKQECDKIICLGDLVGYGPRPNEVIELIMEADIETLMGNHDEAVGFYLSHCGCNTNSAARKEQSKNTMKWTSENTSEEHKAWLRNLPDELHLSVNGIGVSAFHGSPDSITEYVYSNQQQRIHEILDNVEASLVLLGHTHYPFVHEWNNKMLINPGSLGKPKDNNPDSCYVVIDIGEKMESSFIRVPYDIDKVIDDINRTNLLEVFGQMLRLGKMIG